MVTQTDSYIIPASPREVFEYMDDSTNAAKATPSLTHAKVTDTLDNGGKEITAQYEVAGLMNGEIKLTATEHEPHNRIRFQISGDIKGYVEWRFSETDNGQTIFEYEAEFNPQISAPSFIVDKIVSHINSREVDKFVENLVTELSH